MESKYVSSTELAKHFAVSVPTVRQWMRQKKIPPNMYIKVGTAYRFLLEDIEQFFFKLNTRHAEIKSRGGRMLGQEVPDPDPVVIDEAALVDDEEQEVFPFDADDDV